MKKFIRNELLHLGLVAIFGFIIIPGLTSAHKDFRLKEIPQDIELTSLFENEIEFESDKKLPVELPEAYKSERASYAYNYSGGDRDFVLTLNAECGSWNCYIHDVKYKRQGQLWSDGFQCGISAYYHTDKFLKAKEYHYLGDWKSIISICHELYTKGTRFYGYDVRHERGKHIKFNN